MTKAEPLGLSEEDRALIGRVLCLDTNLTGKDGMIISWSMAAKLIAAAREEGAARSQPIGVVETHFERPESTCADLVKGRSDTPRPDGRGAQ